MKTFRDFSKDTKQQEIKTAEQSKLKSLHTKHGIHMKVLIHPGSRSVERRSDMSHEDWNHILHKTGEHIKEKNLPEGHYISYSNKHKQGIVYHWMARQNKAEILTALPKGKNIPREGTKLHMIESVNIDANDMFSFIMGIHYVD